MEILKFIWLDVVQKNSKSKGKPTEKEIIQSVRDESFFGLIQCDIHTPEKLKPKFSEMTPIFKNVEISRADIGDHMRAYCEKEGLLKQPRRGLIGSYFGKGILLITPLAKWYLDQGLEITNVKQIVEYKPVECFQNFAEKVTAARRQGDRDADSSILADSYKLLGNSAYGKTLEDLSRHKDVKYVTNSAKLVNDPLFREQTVLGANMMEVSMAKRVVDWNLPNHIGFFVYQYAKLRMLDFYYSVVAKFIDDKDFQMAEMDTDSLYFSISGPSLDSVIKRAKRREFYSEFHKWFPSPACDTHRQEFIECKVSGEEWSQAFCCKQRQLDDKRTPGLFKVEYEGKGCVALTSKTHFCFGDTNKLASKGLNIRLNNLTKERYIDVLLSRRAGSGTNRGFRAIDNKILTYEQERAALPYLYTKRKVGADGLSTTPLDL